MDGRARVGPLRTDPRPSCHRRAIEPKQPSVCVRVWGMPSPEGLAVGRWERMRSLGQVHIRQNTSGEQDGNCQASS